MSTLTQFFGGGGATVPAFQGGPVGDGITVAEVLLVGGGGSGAPGPVINYGCTGGTSGEVIHSTSLFFTQGTSYTITIGAAATASSIVGGTLNLIAAAGFPGGGPQVQGHRNTKLDQYTTSYGYPGATGYLSPDSRTHQTPSCGGGAVQPGKDFALNDANSGGEGLTLSITGALETYGSGGGGAFPGGVLGGVNAGRGGVAPAGAGGNAVANTGSGGGGGAHTSGAGGSGASGICVIRWPTAFRNAPSVAGNTPTPAQPGYYVYRWNSGPGSITF